MDEVVSPVDRLRQRDEMTARPEHLRSGRSTPSARSNALPRTTSSSGEKPKSSASHHVALHDRPLVPESLSSLRSGPRSNHSKDSPSGSQSSVAPMAASSLLQERLQKERRSELDRSWSRLGVEAPKPTGDKPIDISANSLTTSESPHKQAMGARETEQMMSVLHKQNFDLKLELYHRRQRQEDLEARATKTETEAASLQAANDLLIQELEQRDKAVAEAVAMIVSLETRIELLLKEREMVRQIDNDRSIYAHLEALHLNSPSQTPRPDDVSVNGRQSALNRMPSFVSERTNNTDNLRHAYVKPRDSMLSTGHDVDDARDLRGHNRGFTSPSMSILTEASFISVYGRKSDIHSSRVPENVLSLADQSEEGNEPFRSCHAMSPQRASTARPADSIAARPPPRRRSGSFHWTNDRQITPVIVASNTVSTPGPDRPFVAEQQNTQILLSRESNPGARTLSLMTAHDLGVKIEGAQPETLQIISDRTESLRSNLLPPTPDTASSAMLNRGQPLEHDSDDPDYKPTPTRKTAPITFDEMMKSPLKLRAHERLDSSVGERLANNSLFPSRPRSADETTISRHRNRWDSDSEQDSNDQGSNASSFDFWLRESQEQPVRSIGKGSRGMASVSQTKLDRGSPDLFSFPTNSKGWKADVMFGNLGGSGYYGTGAPAAHILDELGASLSRTDTNGSGSAPASGSNRGPPAPNRRSSLNARTGSTPGTPVVASPMCFAQDTVKGTRRRRRANSLAGSNMQGSHSKSTVTSPRHEQLQTEDVRMAKTQPPPKSNHPMRPLSRVNNLFRRSIGSAPPVAAHAASLPQTEPSTPVKMPVATSDVLQSTIGTPSWARRAYTEEGLQASVTPPPIMRKRATEGASVEGDDYAMIAPIPPTSVNNLAAEKRARRFAQSRAENPGLGAGLGNVIQERDGGASLTPTDVKMTLNKKKGWFGLSRVTSAKTGGA